MLTVANKCDNVKEIKYGYVHSIRNCFGYICLKRGGYNVFKITFKDKKGEIDTREFTMLLTEKEKLIGRHYGINDYEVIVHKYNSEDEAESARRKISEMCVCEDKKCVNVFADGSIC